MFYIYKGYIHKHTHIYHFSVKKPRSNKNEVLKELIVKVEMGGGKATLILFFSVLFT